MDYNRYYLSKNDDDEYWTVFDIFIGGPAEANGSPLTHCLIEEAEDLVALLNAEHIASRKATVH